ncbi:S26 family signal peptidase [Halosolutus gelatinilyticus]|uniref:S26 family signal peptidase n=1 Tax=Halosolutus gelatinilyticus TaxID=2931975 RepID=UPI001FF3AAC3|nr:S26 family signal peptidase [Halosolutus gelatinilyticus]
MTDSDSPASSDDDTSDGVSTGDAPVTIEDDGIGRWLLRSDDDTAVLMRDVVSIAAVVAVVGLLLFAVSGVWPPFVAVESPSMEPNMNTGDLVFVVDQHRFEGAGTVADTGVVTKSSAADSSDGRFGGTGDVIVFAPGGDRTATPIIHRAHFWVDDGENWVDTKANQEYLGGNVDCDDVTYCPAPHAGFITKGDANLRYDQAGGGARTTVVAPGWITGKALFRIPWLGYVRLAVDSVLVSVPVLTGLTVAGASIGIRSSFGRRF